MRWDDRLRVAWLVRAGLSVAMLGSAGCLAAGATPTARHASSPSASAEPAAHEFEAAPSSGGEKRRRRVVIAGLAIAGVAAAAGVGFAVRWRDTSLSADAKMDALTAAGGAGACVGGQRAHDCAELRRLRGEAATLLNLTVWSLLGSGVVELATGIYGVSAMHAKHPKKRGGYLRVSPALDTTGAAITVTSAF